MSDQDQGQYLHTQSAAPRQPSLWPRNPSAPPDPGSPNRRRIASIACVVLVAIVAISQQISAHSASDTPADAKPGTSIASIYSKIMVKVFGALGPSMSQTERDQLRNNVSPALQEMAMTADERIGVVVAQGELGDAELALTEIDRFTDWLILNADLAAKNPLGQDKQHPKVDLPTGLNMIDYYAAGPQRAEYELDAESLRAIYKGTATAEQTSRLATRHGFFGKLAPTHADKKGKEHQALVASGFGLVMVMGLAGLVFLGAFLAGFVCFIIALVQILSRKIQPRMDIPDPGGSVYLELVALFVGGFFAVKILVTVVGYFAMKDLPQGAEAPAWLTTFSMAIQWVLVLVPFYPLVVGVPASRWKSDLGLHAPRGIFREIAFGVFAYFAGLPVLFLGAVTSLILKLISDQINKTVGAPPSNPVIEEVMNANVGTLLLFFCLATFWAPFVEEAVFRGALFRHLRSWLILPIAAIGSALVFGLMHGYEIIMLGPVIALGFTFAMMRHYRGSLVSAITAHALHNGTIMTLLISIITLAKG